jgi:hypothetical protein
MDSHVWSILVRGGSLRSAGGGRWMRFRRIRSRRSPGRGKRRFIDGDRELTGHLASAG